MWIHTDLTGVMLPHSIYAEKILDCCFCPFSKDMEYEVGTNGTWISYIKPPWCKLSGWRSPCGYMKLLSA